MKKLMLLAIPALLIASCTKYDKNHQHAKIETEYGNIVVKLYNSTPNHTNNFVKLINNKFYDGIIFHRVIDKFMIQGGDPDTKNSEPNKLYGEKDAGYLIDAEFNDTIFHKRGCIAMAREGDNVNPEKKSSSSQFYIVVGKKFTEQELDSLEIKLFNRKVSNYSKTIYSSLLREMGDTLNNTKIKETIETIVMAKVDSFKHATPMTKFSNKQREIYTTVGGTPHLDQNYTVFGEVIEGYEVVEKISLVERDANDRPLKDIKMKISLIK
ncbi:MAG: peptidylprolyl isomerase [Bacteroidales bacterium]|nr:peptidylprolyl isomerase [Bacteroidales bacterium]